MRVPKEVRERAQKLRVAIAAYRAEVHERDESSISPEALDSLKHELVTLEEAYPSLRRADSPTQQVAGAILPGLKKVVHAVQQWSLDDAFNEEEVRAFDERVRRGLIKAGYTEAQPSYSTELKIDGLHIVLTYEKGKLVRAATRGDGVVGEDVTQNVRTVRGLPHTLARPVDLIVEGEIYMTRSGLRALNLEQEKLGKPLFANPRNAAAGSLRQLDAAVAAARPLAAFLYDIDVAEEGMPDTQSAALEYLSSLGLPVNPHTVHATSLDAVLSVWKTWEKKREDEDYLIDGVVLKVDERTYREALGHTGKGPRFALALKFPAEQVTTTIREISLQVGRTGVLTPVAHMDPVPVAGTVVARATLHNEDFIREKDIRVGDTVILQKAGDIIPEIVMVLPEFRTGEEQPWKFPTRSSLCGGDGRIERVPGTAARRCAVSGSFDQQLRKLTHFASKGALDIDGLASKTVQLLMEHELVADADDFFELTYDEVRALPGFKEKSARNLIDALNAKKLVSLDRLLVGLSIPHVGAETAYVLALQVHTLPALMRATRDTLRGIPGVGDIVADAVVAWCADTENIALVERLQKHLTLTSVEKDSAEGPLLGVSVVITGTFDAFSRDEGEALVRRAGGTVSSAVSKKTGFVLAGKKPGSKLKEAGKLGILVLGEEEFLERLKT